MVSYFEARRVLVSDKPTEVPPWLPPILPAAKNAKILDLGCGRGGLLLALRALGYANLHGVDGDSEAVAYCIDKGLSVSNYDIANWRPDDFRDFDFVIMTHVLEHLPKDRMIPILSAILAALAAEGKLYVTVPNAQSNTGSYWAFEDFTHNWLFTSGSLYYVAKMAGFNTIEFVDIDCTAGNRLLVRCARRVLMGLYRANVHFWNRVTRSTYHSESEEIFSFEIKALLSR